MIIGWSNNLYIMKLKPRYGINNIAFSMSKNDVTMLLDNPDKIDD